jgi:hypothetical protein
MTNVIDQDFTTAGHINFNLDIVDRAAWKKECILSGLGQFQNSGPYVSKYHCQEHKCGNGVLRIRPYGRTTFMSFSSKKESPISFC